MDDFEDSVDADAFVWEDRLAFTFDDLFREVQRVDATRKEQVLVEVDWLSVDNCNKFSPIVFLLPVIIIVLCTNLQHP